jgi:hypothetical protein
MFNTIVRRSSLTIHFKQVSYETPGKSHLPVEETREAYITKPGCQDTSARTVGTGSHKSGTLVKSNAGVTALPAAAAVSIADGDSVAQGPGKNAF